MTAPISDTESVLRARWNHFRAHEAPAAEPASAPVLAGALDYYVRSAPCPQNALDIFKGEWSSALPGDYATLQAGRVPLFEDVRIAWADQQLGGFENRHVLELGPLEGGHTFMMERMGAASVTAIEANARAYLKCLLTKEILQLKRVRFLCGDLMEYLRTDSTRYDICIASGVLYHMRDPVELLARLAERTDRLFLWTHYHDPFLLSRNALVAEHFTGTVQAEYAGIAHTLHRYEYGQALEWNGFCGGTEAFGCWLERGDILACLGRFGFDEVRTAFEEPEGPHGPSLALAALRHDLKNV